jgi:hypothetical protein
VEAHPAIHLIADASALRPDGFSLRVAGSHPLGENATALAVETDLGHRDAVERRDPLAVAGARQAVPAALRRPDRHGAVPL